MKERRSEKERTGKGSQNRFNKCKRGKRQRRGNARGDERVRDRCVFSHGNT